MTQNAGSLDNLRDIAEPAPISWWPPALGWWGIAAIAAVASVFYAHRIWQRWKANAYRRAAMAELKTAAKTADVAQILKRTALCVYSRTDVASLTGSAWCNWLGETGGMDVPEIVSQQLIDDVFRADSTNTPELTSFAKQWIHNHSIPTQDRKGREGKGDSRAELAVGTTDS